MHMYYTEFDWLDDADINAVLPEDGVPETLHIEDLEDEEPASGLSKQDFQDWLWEGRHDCEVALAFLRMWVGTMRGTGNDTIGDFFDQLLFEHREATSEVARTDADAHMPRLPVGYIAELLHRFGHVPERNQRTCMTNSASAFYKNSVVCKLT